MKEEIKRGPRKSPSFQSRDPHAIQLPGSRKNSMSSGKDTISLFTAHLKEHDFDVRLKLIFNIGHLSLPIRPFSQKLFKAEQK